MYAFLDTIVIVLLILVFTGYINEKFIKIPLEVCLLIVSLIIGLILIIFFQDVNSIFTKLFSLEVINNFLIKGVLCFMLFSGSYKISFKLLKDKLKIISLMAIFTTMLSALIFGVLCYYLFQLLNLDFSLNQCLLIGCILAPTDPIAAMSILNKVGLNKDIGLTIEGESLFNDGVGIALFLAIGASLNLNQQAINPLDFISLLLKEVFGAVIIGLIISFILWKLFSTTKDKNIQIFISLLAVSSIYVICQHLGFSSAIAAVVCGIYFATMLDKELCANNQCNDYQYLFDFYSVIDSLLNGALYIILGLTSINILIYTSLNIVPIIITILLNFIGRYFGVLLIAILVKEKPANLSVIKFTNLLSYAGLKGALCLALAIDAFDYFKINEFHTVIIIVFSVVLFTTLIQGLTIGKFYNKYYLN